MTAPPFPSAPPSVPPTPPRKPRGSGLAISAIVLGAVSLAFSWIPFVNILSVILGFAGIIVGLLGLFFSHRIMSLIGIVLALVGVILGFVVTSSAVSSISHAVDAPSPSAGSQSAQGPNVPPAFQGATVNDRVAQSGEVVNTNGLSLTSSAVKRGDGTFGKSLCTTVKYGNGTNAAVSFNEFDWKLQGPNGAILSTTIGGSRNLLNSGDLAPGGSVSGDVCFDAKSGAQGQYVVLYQGSIFSGDRIAWLNKI